MQAIPYLLFHKHAFFKTFRAPRYWQDITAHSGVSSLVQRRDWLLVLSARNIPWRICKTRGIEHIYVPALYERLAKHELSAYMRENIIHNRKTHYPPHPFAFLAWLIFIPLIIWHGYRAGVWHTPELFTSSDKWLLLGDLDKIRLSLYHEYYRAITALTLHADAAHLAGNIFFGSIFLLIISRLIGPGRAVLFTIIGGIGGNLLSSLIHNGDYASIGFSTALFAAVGIMGGVLLCRATEKRKLLIYTGGAIALLAMLGTEGDNTDYAAHICGLFCGFICGLYEGWREKSRLSALSQTVAFLIAIFIPVLAWLAAFGKFRIWV